MLRSIHRQTLIYQSMLIVLLFIVNKPMLWINCLWFRGMLCNAPFLSLNFWDYSNDKVNPVNRKCNINCWTALEELYNGPLTGIYFNRYWYISAKLIVILNLCTLIEILLKVFIGYIRLEIGKVYFESMKNNYLLHKTRLVLLW